MWNRFGRVVTLGVGAGVHCYLNCRSCTHVCVSIGFSQFQMIPNSCMWDHDLPAGIAPAEDEQALPTRHFAPVEDALCFSFLLPYSMYPNLLTMVCELRGWRYPNLLPVAGGGGVVPHAVRGLVRCLAAPSCTCTVLTAWSAVLPVHDIAVCVTGILWLELSSYILLWYRVCPRHLIVSSDLQAIMPNALHWV
jgi:hypothetical protein